MVQCVSILGSTGSIGRQSLDIIRRLPGIQVAALTAGTNVDRMAQQCREFSPKLAVMATQEAAQALAERINDLPIRVNWGEAGLMEAASMADADCVITAVVGMVGLKPTLAAIRAKKRIGLANKETLVCAGELVMAEAEKYIGYPYVWGGSSPSTSFDCSGFVSWVINHSGWDVGRLGAQGLCNICTPVSPEQAKPGDLVFFVGTYDTPGVSHVGIYVGNSVMLHCGDPISYTNLNSSYWQEHFYCYGRLP